MLSKGTVTIIAVCSAIVFLLVILVITNWYSPPSTPLPTVQPLAHHREHYLGQFHSSMLEDGSQLSIPSISDPNTSTVSLLPTPDSKRHQSPSNRSRSITSRSTVFSKNSHNRLHGAPHGPHSKIQIVLPAPLALNVNASNSTLSIADNWVSASIPNSPH